MARIGLDPSILYCYLDVLRNRSSRLEMVMYLLFVVAANGGCECYRVGGARGAQTRWLTIPRSGLQLNLSFFLLDLARNGREAFSRSITGCRRGVLYPCWQLNFSPSRSLALYNFRRFQNPHQSLMLDCLARKRRYVCCCRKELLVLGSISCWRLVHIPQVRHSPVLFLFNCIPRLGWHTLCVDWLG